MTEEISRIQSALSSGLFRFDKLAETAGVHRNTLRAATRKGWSPNAKTVQKLIDALDRAGA